MITRDMADGVYEIPESTYHADRSRLSNSAIGMFLKDRRKFVKQYIRGEKVASAYRPEFAFGSLFHGIVEGTDVWQRFATEPASYDDLYRDLCEECPEDKAGKSVHRGSKAYKQWKALQEGKEIVQAADADLAAVMVNALKSHDVASEIIFDPNALRERVLIWNDEETGEPMRARLDHHFKPDYRPLVTDIKTIEGRRDVSPMEDPDMLAAHAFKYGYHRQLAVYMDAYKAVYGVYPEGRLIFVEKREVDPMVVVLRAVWDDVAICDGRDGMHNGQPIGYRPALRQIQALRERGDWRHAHQTGEHQLMLPEWRVRQAMNEMELTGLEEVA